MNILKCFFSSCMLLSFAKCMPNGNYANFIALREKFLQQDKQYRIGHDIELSPQEQVLNDKLVKLKSAEIELGRTSGGIFPPAMHFFHAKPLIEKSKVFEILKDMPKGAALHVHDVSLVDAWWIVKNVTYRNNCYMCFNKQTNVTSFKFSSNTPTSPDCSWELVASVREKSGDAETFDNQLYKLFSLEVADPVTAYPDLHSVWTAFENKLRTAEGLLFYAPVYKDYFVEGLQQFTADNIQSIELRSTMPQLYDLSGKEFDQEYTLRLYIKTTMEFMQNHPKDFFAAKFIFTGIRVKDADVIANDIKLALDWSYKYPYFIGYDLVGQEGSNSSHPLLYYLPQLLSTNGTLRYFFHAGETDWKGTEVDENLVDAVLLNTSRIGHGYAITKHPRVLQKVIEQNIPVEVNPISNQVLKLVDDLRNHPASHLMSVGAPIVISSDDPGVWGAKALSYDFYMAFMGFGGNYSDLATLKKLALNSIQYSVLGDWERENYMTLFNDKWNTFITKTLLRFGLL